MARKAPQLRSFWEDRYHRPDLQQLVCHLSREQAQILLYAREQLRALAPFRDSIVWHGVPWRWSIAFSTGGDRPWAYLVPLPSGPVLAVPMTAELVASLHVRKLSRIVRDGLVSAARVGDGYWPQWGLASRTQVDELIDILRCKLEGHLSPTA
jgi:hypothetical protein